MPCAFSFTTETYRTSPTDYLIFSARPLLTKIATALVLPLLCCIVASIKDLRFAFIALIIVFLIAPLVMAYIYYSRLLTIEAQRAIWQKHIIFDGESRSITVIFDSDDSECKPPKPIIIKPNDVKQVQIRSKQLIMELKDKELPLIIPTVRLPFSVNPYDLCNHFGFSTLNPQ